MFSLDEISESERLLKQSLSGPIPAELNELDWKSNLSSKSERLKEHLSALSNYPGGGYLVFGVADDGTIEGISEEDARKVCGKLANIGRDGLEPKIGVDFHSLSFRKKSLLVVRVRESVEKPVYKRGGSLDDSFIRSSGTTRKMSTQEIRVALIGSRSLRFEELPAAIDNSIVKDLVAYFDFDQIYRRCKRPDLVGSVDYDFLHANKLLSKSGDRYLPTNLCVLCAAKDLSRFPGYERYAVRVTRFVGTSRLGTKGDEFFYGGFALTLDDIVDHIIKQLPYSEIIKRATRIEVPLIPEAALREIIPNAVIHRDYARTSSYVSIDIFDDRIEVTNPGELLPNIGVDHLIDHPSVTRNEVLADLMRKMKFCEEEGTGIDKAVAAMEVYGLPPVKFQLSKDFFKVILFAPKEYANMEKEERIEAVYQHAVLNLVAGKKTTNATIRQRFHFDDRQSTKVTRLLAEAIEAERVRLANPGASPRDMHYLPYWATSQK